MNDNQMLRVAAEDKTIQEGSNLILDDSDLSTKRGRVIRQKFSNMNKTVILIRANPDDWTESDRIRVGTPNSLMAIGAVLKDVNIPVEFVDFSVLNPEEEVETLNKLASRDDILIVSFSLISVQVGHCLRIMKRLKEAHPNTKIIIGGRYAVLYPEETCKHELIDYVCYADGEEMMVDLVEFIYYKRGGYPTHVPALLYKKDGVVQKNPMGNLPEIE